MPSPNIMKPTAKLTPLILSNWSWQGLVSNIFPKSGLSAASGRGLARGKHASPVQHAARGWRGLTGCLAWPNIPVSRTQSPVSSLQYPVSSTQSPAPSLQNPVSSTQSPVAEASRWGYIFARNCLAFGMVRFLVLLSFFLEKNHFSQCPCGHLKFEPNQ